MVIKVYIASTSGSISVRATRTAWHALDMSWVHMQHPGLGKAAELFLNSVMSRGWTHQQACCSVFPDFGSRWAPLSIAFFNFDTSNSGVGGSLRRENA